jgi:sugar phosphate isomerase/epimerase
MLSCSTCWNSSRHTNGEEMLDEIVELGFENIELGHGIRLSLVDGILRFREKSTVRFSSLHNFCPLPIEITRAAPDCYQFSSQRQSERERAAKLTCQTIDFAELLGAPFVVLHLGRVPIAHYTDDLLRQTREGELFSRKFVRDKISAVKHREAAAPFYLKRVKEVLAPIAEYAAMKGIRLGIESRQAYEEIPSERELPELLDHFASPALGYWHDFGHVQTKANIGFLDHHEWLSRMASRLLGCHLHDVEWPGKDHSPPFTGSIVYDDLVRLLPPDSLFVWEMSPRRNREEIVTSLHAWRERFGK